MPPSRPVEGMEKVFLCDNEEEKKRFISWSTACQSHHIPKTVRGCISPNRLVSNIGESILHVQLQLVDFHGRQNINIRKYSFLKKKVRLACKQCDYWHLNYFMSEIFSQRAWPFRRHLVSALLSVLQKKKQTNQKNRQGRVLKREVKINFGLSAEAASVQKQNNARLNCYQSLTYLPRLECVQLIHPIKLPWISSLANHLSEEKKIHQAHQPKSR